VGRVWYTAPMDANETPTNTNPGFWSFKPAPEDEDAFLDALLEAAADFEADWLGVVDLPLTPAQRSDRMTP
jgi:hypothetical protein